MKFSKKRNLLLAALALALLGSSPFLVQKAEQAKVYTVDEVASQTVAIVFGAGLGKSGGPSDMLYDRLTVASQLYKAGKVEKILVSGDNSYEDYNEPEVMAETLKNAFAIPDEVIAQDFAGRRTYDTCIRAKTVWGVDVAILVTQDFHLPRALYTCNAVGVESVGVSASLQPYLSESYNWIREYPATLASFVDLYVWAPTYIHGEKETW